MQGNHALQTLEAPMDIRELSEFFKRENFLRFTNDAVFKRFFTRSKKRLKSLLQSILPLPENASIVDVTILNPELTPQKLTGKKGKTFILDLEVQFAYQSPSGKKTEIVGVEMQTSTEDYFLNRLMAYSGRVYSEQLEEGEDYEKLAPVYSLVFSTVNLRELAQVRDHFHICNLTRKDAPRVVVSRALGFVFVELKKFTKSAEELDSARDKWFYVLKNSHKLGIKECKQLLREGDGEMKNVLKNLWDLSLDPELRREARAIDKWERDQRAKKRCAEERGHREGHQKGHQKGHREGHREGRQEGRQEGLQEGMKKGEQKKAQEIAKTLLTSGADPKFVAETTGLSKDEIETLKRCS